VIAGSALAAILCLLLVGWRNAYVHVYASVSEHHFRVLYTEGVVPWAPEDWAWRFGGRTGLSRLLRLSKDENFTDLGRDLARRTYDCIAEGRHLPYILESISEDGELFTFWELLQLECTYALDSP